MRKFIIIVFFGLASSFGLFFCGLHEFGNSLTEARMVEALQEALFLGSQTAADNLGDASCASSKAAAGECATGYLGNKLVEIAVPDTVKNVLNQIDSFAKKVDKLDPLVGAALDFAFTSFFASKSSPDIQAASSSGASGFLSSLSGYADEIKTALNRGAEQAAPASVDVFKNAIFGMSFSDARGVLLGDSVAATSYLHNVTYNGLQTAFGPIIKEPLDLLNPNKFWKPIASSYNSFANAYSNAIQMQGVKSAMQIANVNNMPNLPYSNLTDDLSGYLAEYATGKALDGLFKMVGKQEASLRADPWGTVSAVGGIISDAVGDLLGDVFSKAKDNSL